MRTVSAPFVSAAHLSAILNLVCPECGGPMGGRSKVFQCQGRCGTDWRSVWESVSVKPRAQIRRRDRMRALPHSERTVQNTAVGREHQSAVSTLGPDGKVPSEALIVSLGWDSSAQTQALR